MILFHGGCKQSNTISTFIKLMTGTNGNSSCIRSRLTLLLLSTEKQGEISAVVKSEIGKAQSLRPTSEISF